MNLRRIFNWIKFAKFIRKHKGEDVTKKFTMEATNDKLIIKVCAEKDGEHNHADLTIKY